MLVIRVLNDWSDLIVYLMCVGVEEIKMRYLPLIRMQQADTNAWWRRGNVANHTHATHRETNDQFWSISVIRLWPGLAIILNKFLYCS